MSAAPGSTYRLQIHAGFSFADAAQVVPYLANLGVTHLYLSPILQPTTGSAHGYDVVDHATIHREAGGLSGLLELRARAGEAGLGLIVDVVPNHMAVPTPVEENRALWSVLQYGPDSPFASWFDIDWTQNDDGVLMPVLGDRLGVEIEQGRLHVEHQGERHVLRYGDQVFPLRPGTEHLRRPQDLPELLARQFYRLAWWRVGEEELNYRRFFDVDTLAAVRVEDPEVFEQTHRLLLDLIHSAVIEGLRIDHIDGLADPRGYLRRLREASNGAWVVVEKILAADESLPQDWPCAGTTGYDSLWRIAGLFADPAGAAPLSSLLTETTGQATDFAPIATAGKYEVVAGVQAPEIHRLVDLLLAICHDDVMLRDHTRGQVTAAVTELIVAMNRYRAYVVPGEPASQEAEQVIEQAALRAMEHVPEPAIQTVELVRDLVLGRPIGSRSERAGRRTLVDDVIVRFQQTCGPVMAKGVEDTGFYRWHRLIALNEVGGEPEILGVAPEAFHDYASLLQSTWPTAMTTLSTHDTKRSEDVRARILTLSEYAQPWADAVRSWNEATRTLRSATGPSEDDVYLFWQTLIGLWSPDPGAAPPETDRLVAYMVKAAREAKLYSTWTTPDEAYEQSLTSFVQAVMAPHPVLAGVNELCELIAAAARVNTLGQKLIQLTMPGVPDIYQGCECVEQTLVDPDNRRPVDFRGHAGLLAALDEHGVGQSLSEEKLWLTAQALRLRRQYPDAFIGPDARYEPLATTTGNAVAFGRGTEDGIRAVTVVTRLSAALSERGGWGEHCVMLPAGQWRNVLDSSRSNAAIGLVAAQPLSPTQNETFDGGPASLAALLSQRPVALLERVGEHAH